MQNILADVMDITSAPTPESEGNSTTSPPPSPTSSPPPSPISTPPPSPVTPSVCSYIGTYRLQPVACPGKYLAVFPGCGDKSVVLRTSMQAPGARIRWNLNTTAVNNVGVPSPILSLRNCPASATYLTSPSGDTRQPTLGGSSWRFQVIPSSASCSTVHIVANSRLSNAPYLGVSAKCDSFVWYTSGNSTNTEFKAISSA
jgi:hypothetical protein